MDEQKGKPWKGLWPLKEGKTRLSRAGPMSAMILLLEVQTQEAFLFHCPLDKELTRRIEANLEPSLMEAMMDDDFFFFFSHWLVKVSEFKDTPTILISQASEMFNEH